MRLTESTVLLRLETNKLGNSRKGDLNKVATAADKDRLRLGKRLFDCKEYEAIQSFDAELRTWVTQRAIQVPSVGFPGLYILPLGLVEKVEARLTEARAKREELVAAFMGVYDQQIEQARNLLKDQFNAGDYKPRSEAAGSFGLRWAYVTFEVPKNLPPELAEREARSREVAFRNMEAEVKCALRTTLCDMLTRLNDSLTPGEDGRKKKFYTTTVTNLAEFLELFAARNVADDNELAALAEQAKAIIQGASPDDLREDGDLRAAVQAKTQVVLDKVKTLVAAEGKRKFDFDLE